jgi:predicted nucleotidyltransferase
MISSFLQNTVRQFARQFDVTAVWLFGSSLGEERQAQDIDMAVEGIAPERFFDFYRELFLALPKPVDLVDLSVNPPIASIIRAKGIRIYERGQ